MRYVEPNPYHAWAHQTRDHGRNQGDTKSFSGTRAYSYAACIGEIVTNSVGDKAYYLNDHNYSVTTRRHQGELARAIPSYATVIRFDEGITRNEADGRNYFLNKMAESLAKAKRARKYGEFHLNSAADTYEMYVKWCAFEGYDAPDDTFDMESLIAQIEEARKKELAAEKIRQEKVRLDNLDKIVRWHDGENIYLPYDCGYLLRLKDGMVETSHYAKVPWADVKKVLPIVLKAISDGTELPSMGMLGNYPFNGVDLEGTVHIGCHHFLKSEVLRFAETVKDV